MMCAAPPEEAVQFEEEAALAKGKRVAMRAVRERMGRLSRVMAVDVATMDR